MKIGNPEERVRLRELAEKIRVLIKEYDVAGIVNLQGKDQAEYAMEIEPSWSCMRFVEENGKIVGFRFNARMKTGTADEKENARVTVGMVLGFKDVLDYQTNMIGTIMRMLGKHMSIDHVGIEQPNRIEPRSTDGPTNPDPEP